MIPEVKSLFGLRDAKGKPRDNGVGLGGSKKPASGIEPPTD